MRVWSVARLIRGDGPVHAAVAAPLGPHGLGPHGLGAGDEHGHALDEYLALPPPPGVAEQGGVRVVAEGGELGGLVCDASGRLFATDEHADAVLTVAPTTTSGPSNTKG